jgi:microcystin-dependent protein
VNRSHRGHHPAESGAFGFGAVPVGAVIAFAGKVGAAPDGGQETLDSVLAAWGWMVCDGRQLAIGDYPELFAFIGHHYDQDAEDGSFHLPDYRGYFLRGVDGGSGNDPEAADRSAAGSGATPADVGSRQTDAIRDHIHGIDPAGAATAATGGPPAMDKTRIAAAVPSAIKPPDGVSARETRPRNISVHYLIKFTVRPHRPHVHPHSIFPGA